MKYRQLGLLGPVVAVAFLAAVVPGGAVAKPGDSTQERLERLETLLNEVSDDVDDIVVGRNSASLNAAVCISTGVGTAAALAAEGELGGRWDLGILADIHGKLAIDLHGDSTMAADICINVPIVSIGETSIPTSTEPRAMLQTASGRQVKLTAAETMALEDELARIAGELETVGLAMGNGLGQLWDTLDPAAVLSPETNPLMDPESLILGVSDVIVSGSFSGTPFAKLPLANEAEDAMRAMVSTMDPCELIQLNSMMRDVPGLEELVCTDALMTGLNEVVADVNQLPNTLNAGFNTVNSNIGSGFNTVNTTLGNGFNNLSGELGNGISQVRGDVALGINSTWAAVDGATTVISGELHGQVSQLGNTVNNTLGIVQNNLNSFMNNGFNQVKSLVNGVSGVLNSFKNTVEPAVVIIEDIWDKIKKVLNKLP